MSRPNFMREFIETQIGYNLLNTEKILDLSDKFVLIRSDMTL